MSLWDIIVAWGGGWLGTIWSSISGGVNAIGGEISTWISDSKAAVTSWAWDWIDWLNDKIDDLKSWWIAERSLIESHLATWVATLRSEATALYNAAIKYVVGVAGTLGKAISQAYNDAVTYVDGKIDDLKSWWIAERSLLESHLHTWAKDLVAANVALLKALYAPLLAYLPWLTKAQSILTNITLSKIQDFATRMYAFLLDFTDHPVGVVLSALWGTFIHYLCFAVAYGLGTVEATLPPIPEWGGKDGNPAPLPYPPIPTPTPGLVRPCDPLYVSGFTFTPGHPGTDFGIVNGQAIFAAHDGTVEESHWVDYGFGWTITLRGGKFWTRYGHMEQLLVSSGTDVIAGQTIAYGNSTGTSSGPHLHFEIKINGVYVDPVSVL